MQVIIAQAYIKSIPLIGDIQQFYQPEISLTSSICLPKGKK